MLKVIVIALFTTLTALTLCFDATRASQQTGSDSIKNDSCVGCHSRVSTPSVLSTRYLEWHLSAHGASSVGCEKCHGGDPTNRDANQAHRGVLPASNSRSRLNEATVSETCGACHQAIARSFAESAHYQKLRTSGMGPTCTSCHSHMASSVRRNGAQGETLCTYCHNAVDGLLPPRPDIPANSKATLDAIQRTEYVLTWINELMARAEKRNISVDSEMKDITTVKASVQRTKVAWHTFNVGGVLEMANGAFSQAVDIKDRLNRKLGRD